MRHAIARLSFRVAIVGLCCSSLASFAFMNAGWNNLGSQGSTTWTNQTTKGWTTGSGATLTNGSDGEAWAGGGLTGSEEVSWSVDWHSTAQPARDVGRLMLFPSSRTVGHFRVYSGAWSGSSMTWTPVYETTVTGLEQITKPYFVNLDVTGANGLKYEVLEPGNLAYVTNQETALRKDRGMGNIMVFRGGSGNWSDPVRLVSPVSATQSTTAPYDARFTQPTLNLSFDGLRNDVQGFNNDSTQHYESVTYTLAQPMDLLGVFIDISTIHNPMYCWKTWEIRDLDGTLLAQSQLGASGDNAIVNFASENYQFLKFTTGPRTMSGFIMQGKFGILAPPGDATHGNRLGEVWAVFVPEPATAALFLLSAGVLVRRRSRASC